MSNYKLIISLYKLNISMTRYFLKKIIDGIENILTNMYGVNSAVNLGACIVFIIWFCNRVNIPQIVQILR